MKRPLTEHLQEIVATEDEERADNDLWIRRGQGRASSDEVALLDARAAEDEESAHLLHATRPLSAAREDALLALLCDAPATKPAPPVAVAPVVPISRARRHLVWGAPALAAAAALILVLRSRGGPVSPLPMYEVAVAGVDAETRAAPVAPAPNVRHAVSAGARLKIVARPIEAAPSPIAATAFAMHGGAPRVLSAPRVTPSGTVSLEGAREELFGDLRGEVDVVLWIGAPGSIPTTVAEAAAAAPTGDGVRRVVVLLDLRNARTPGVE